MAPGWCREGGQVVMTSDWEGNEGRVTWHALSLSCFWKRKKEIEVRLRLEVREATSYYFIIALVERIPMSELYSCIAGFWLVS